MRRRPERFVVLYNLYRNNHIESILQHDTFFQIEIGLLHVFLSFGPQPDYPSKISTFT